ncbi:MAG TPA: flagellar biosynthesis protein FlhF [Gallionella sp.]|nr:flagellar biosynthesis protein FlhF [Gallionella sp.]
MNIRKFIAPTARQALRNIRSELGDEAVILSNRKVGEGVEIIALANEEITRITDTTIRKLSHGTSHKAHDVHQSPDITDPQVAPESSILGEIKSMHSVLQQQLAELSWSGVQQRDPLAAGLLRNMLNSGFSAQLARQFMEKMPRGKTQGVTWINQVLKRNLRVVAEQDDIVVKGGVYALIGPTGVGKTTTTAKLAARAVVRYGADKVALLTTDSYRIGAFEQLKIYGRILGVEVHAVKGAEDLRLTISALRNKHLVLVDTAGMGQRDERVGDQREMFDAVGVPRLLLLNAASDGNTLDDVVSRYHSEMVIGCIPTKLDEAVNLGALLDVLVRHQLVMHYMTNGQCVPEDLHPVNLDYMLHRAFKLAESTNSFTLRDMEFPALMAGEGSFMTQARGLSADARSSGASGAAIRVPDNGGFGKGKDASYAL